VRTNTCDHNLDFFLKLFDQAKKDFPDLEPGNIEIVHYSRLQIAHSFGIEFSVNGAGPVPKCYERIDVLEPIY